MIPKLYGSLRLETLRDLMKTPSRFPAKPVKQWQLAFVSDFGCYDTRNH